MKNFRTVNVLDIARARGVKEGTIAPEDILRVGLPYFSGCAVCRALLGPYQAHPTRRGDYRCAGCVADLGFNTTVDFEAYEKNRSAQKKS